MKTPTASLLRSADLASPDIERQEAGADIINLEVDEEEIDCLLISARATASVLADILADDNLRPNFDSMTLANVAYGISFLVGKARPVRWTLANAERVDD